LRELIDGHLAVMPAPSDPQINRLLQLALLIDDSVEATTLQEVEELPHISARARG